MLKKKIILVILSGIYSSLIPLPASAQAETEPEVRLLPDWSTFTFADFDPVSEPGEIGTELNQIVGWDISRTWKAGDAIEDIIKLGDLENSLAPQLFSLEDIYQKVNQAKSSNLEQEPIDFGVEEGNSQLPSDLLLSDFPLLEDQTLENLSEVVPDLAALEVSEVPPLAELAEQKGFDSSETIGSLVQQDADVAATNLESLDLEQYGFDSVPNLSQTQLKDLEGYEEKSISEIPGLSELPLSDFPNPVTAEVSMVARIDLIWGNAETDRNQTISGSKIEGFNVPCSNNCGYLELDDIENFGRSIASGFEGSQWIQGKDHWVAGGTGCLSGGREPTGIHPFGDTFKSVLWSTDESTASATIVTFFNIKTNCGDSAYFIGPFPFPLGYVAENDWIYLGSGI